jgi:hypothetical protein
MFIEASYFFSKFYNWLKHSFYYFKAIVSLNFKLISFVIFNYLFENLFHGIITDVNNYFNVFENRSLRIGS